MTNLLTFADLAERMQLTEAQAVALRRKNNWPCVRLGGKTIRFTEEQVDQIIAQHIDATRPAVTSAPAIAGQTKGSRSRRSA